MKLWIMIRLVGKILAINFLFLYLKVFLPSLLSLLEQIFWWLLCALIKMNMRTLAFQDLWLNNETSFFSNDSIPLHLYAWLCNLISNFSQIKKNSCKSTWRTRNTFKSIFSWRPPYRISRLKCVFYYSIAIDT